MRTTRWSRTSTTAPRGRRTSERRATPLPRPQLFSSPSSLPFCPSASQAASHADVLGSLPLAHNPGQRAPPPSASSGTSLRHLVHLAGLARWRCPQPAACRRDLTATTCLHLPHPLNVPRQSPILCLSSATAPRRAWPVGTFIRCQASNFPSTRGGGPPTQECPEAWCTLCVCVSVCVAGQELAASRLLPSFHRSRSPQRPIDHLLATHAWPESWSLEQTCRPRFCTRPFAVLLCTTSSALVSCRSRCAQYR